MNEKYVTVFKLPPDQHTPIHTDRIWDFVNPEIQTRCKVLKNKFSIISNKYKSWDEHKSEKGFKDVFISTFKNFQDIYNIQNFERVGLRYINKVKVEDKSSSWLKKYFIPIFNIEKYPIENLDENIIRLLVKKENDVQILVQSTIITEENENFYIIDFDAFFLNLNNEEIIEKADMLHEEILKEFHSLITEECRKKMRGEL